MSYVDFSESTNQNSAPSRELFVDSVMKSMNIQFYSNCEKSPEENDKWTFYSIYDMLLKNTICFLILVRYVSLINVDFSWLIETCAIANMKQGKM